MWQIFICGVKSEAGKVGQKIWTLILNIQWQVVIDFNLHFSFN